MLSLSLFIEAIELIERKREHENALCDALELCAPGNYANALIYSDYETFLCKVLHECLNIPADDDVLEYWLWDCNLGKDFKVGDFQVNGKAVDLTTPEQFYKYIMEEYNTCK